MQSAALLCVPFGNILLNSAGFSLVTGLTVLIHAARGRAGRGRRQKGSLILYSVPYSEHSSFTELREFVRWLQPAKIVPTVGNDRGPKTSSMLSMLRP